MKRRNKFELIIFVFIFLIGTNVSAQKRLKNFDEFFSALARNQDFNGNVLIAEKGRIIYERSFGYADFSAKRLNTKATLFPIASISKTITATAILQQIEKGKLSLNDPAAKYLPDFPYPEITIRHLLSHTSGIAPYNAFFDSVKAENPLKVFTNEDFISGLNANKKPLIYKPGESWNYDNTNFIVLALILEKVSGESYPVYVEKHILQPAKMNQTRFFPYVFDSSKNKIKNLVIPHWYAQIYADEPVRADTMEYVSNYWKTYQFNGFGDYISTTHDLLKYDQALYDGTLLGQKLLQEAFNPVKLNNGKNNSGNYGLGWTIDAKFSSEKRVFHTGGAIGLNCILYRNITKHQTVIAFDIAHSSAFYIAENALKILDGQTVLLPKKKLARVYGKLLVTKGKTIAAEELEKLSKDSANYELDKEDLIRLGYEILGDVNPFHLPFKPRYDEALEVFRQCIKLFPDYWNSYDSYGDALARTGNKKLAVKMYQKSLELKPDSESGKKALQKLLEEK
jgi:CubicO group peptidase (beta-lactamase class C family)